MPVTALVRPGPEVTKATPTSPVARAYPVSGVHSGLFVADQNVLDGFLFVKSVVDVEHCPTGVTPNKLDVFGLQRFDQDFGPTQFLSG